MKTENYKIFSMSLFASDIKSILQKIDVKYKNEPDVYFSFYEDTGWIYSDFYVRVEAKSVYDVRNIKNTIMKHVNLNSTSFFYFK